jgi:hypothetical protein
MMAEVIMKADTGKGYNEIRAIQEDREYHDEYLLAKAIATAIIGWDAMRHACGMSLKAYSLEGAVVEMLEKMRQEP